MKKKLLSFFVFAAVLSSAFAQVSVDPDDYFYTLSQGWEIRGLTKAAPPMRPYPLRNIRQILEDVIENGTPTDVERAKYYMEKINGKPWTVEAGGHGTAKFTFETEYDEEEEEGKSSFDGCEKSHGMFILANPKVYGDISFLNGLVSMGYSAGFAAYKGHEDEFVPLYTNSKHDTRTDAIEAGPLDVYLDVNDAIAVGKTNIFAQAGIYRTGYGDFFDECPAMNDDAFHSANFSFSVFSDKVAYTQILSAIGASSAYDGEELFPDKYFAFHAIEIKPSRKFSVTYYESCVFGQRMDLTYFIPAPYMIGEELSGFGDNVQMGLKFNIIPFDNFMWVTDIYSDDTDLESALKLDLDSKNRFVLQNGFVYTPENSFCTRLGFNYTVITPYTYSHWEYADGSSGAITAGIPSYQNYTNNGLCMGLSIPPNSDRFSLSVDMMPKPNMKIKLFSSFMRHGNVCESLENDEALVYLSADKGVYSTDGSLFTHSMFSDPENDIGEKVGTAWHHLNFLTQDHKMYAAKAGFDLNYEFPKQKWGQFTLKFGYAFEYVHNKGVDNPMYEPVSGLKYDNESGKYKLNATEQTDAELEQIVATSKEAWLRNLHDEMNHYITVGGSFRF